MDAEHFRQVRDAVRQLVREVVVPLEDEDRVLDELRARAADMGLFGYALPEGYGGLGVTMAEDVEPASEFGYTTAAFRSLFGTNNGVAGQVIARFGSDEQRRDGAGGHRRPEGPGDGSGRRGPPRSPSTTPGCPPTRSAARRAAATRRR